MNFKKLVATLLFIYCGVSYAQETLPIYQDYLSDNVYLLHPAAAGVGECAKIRLTARNQWLDVDNAPKLQTLSFHGRINNETKAGFGIILFNDKNGFHSQKGLQGTYAYHLDLDNGNAINQLSFGLSFAVVQNEVDQRSFTINDPVVNQIIESNSYFNADFGVAYHRGGLASYLTIKNIFLSAKDKLTSEFDALNLRNYILGVSYFFGKEKKIQFEPSVMLQFKEQTSEKIIDANFKAYKNIDNAQLWAGVSYRTSFDSSAFDNAQYISPIIGVNYKRFMVGYTYTKQLNDVVISTGGFHQISLGMNLMCRKKRLSACPNINGQLF